jgi:hypothetical protein
MEKTGMKENNKTETIDTWEVENVDDFLRNIFKQVKTQTDAMTEELIPENVIRAIMRPVNSLQQK